MPRIQLGAGAGGRVSSWDRIEVVGVERGEPEEEGGCVEGEESAGRNDT